MDSRKEVLLILPQGLGDIIMARDIIYMCRAYNITCLVKNDSSVELIDIMIERICGHGAKYFVTNIDNTLGFAKIELFIRVVGFVLKSFRKFDISIVPVSVSAVMSSILMFALGSKFRVGWKSPVSFLNSLTFSAGGKHKRDENLKIFKYFEGGEDGYPVQSYRANKDRRVVVFSLGAGVGERKKIVPLSVFMNIAAFLSEIDEAVELILVGGADAVLKNSDILNLMKSNITVLNLIGKTTLKELVEILSDCAVCITSDNGISHICDFLGIPQVVFYGPTDRLLTGVAGDCSFSITSNQECAPCLINERDRRKYNECSYNECMIDFDFKECKRFMLDAMVK